MNFMEAKNIELTDVYVDTSRTLEELTLIDTSELRGLRRTSVKRTPLRFIEVHSPWKSVAQNAPHFLDSAWKLFFRMICPLILVFGIEEYYHWRDCHNAYKKLDNRGMNYCFDPLPGIMNSCLYISVQVTAYLIRKELILKSPLIFSFVKEMKLSAVEQLQFKNEKEWADFLTGRLKNFRPWNIRGYLFLPVIISFSVFIYFLYFGRENIFQIESDRGSCEMGRTWCGPDETSVDGIESSIMLSVGCLLRTFSATHAFTTAIFPLVLISLIVGRSAKSRIGLWDQSDVSLGEVQRISMHASLYMSGVAFFLIFVNFHYAAYFFIGGGLQIFYVSIFVACFAIILFVPIIPAIIVLRDIKEKDFAEICAIEEHANRIFFNLLRDGTKRRLESGKIEQAKADLAIIVQYRLQVEAANVVPSSLKVIRTSLSSVFLGIVLPIFLARTSGAA